MKKFLSVVAAGGLVLAVSAMTLRSSPSEAAAAKTAAELEKEKALANPYPNDFGPEKIDVSKYPANIQEGYKFLQNRCAKCHTAARPLNSQFTEIPSEKVAALKKASPEAWKDPLVWQIEPPEIKAGRKSAGIWERYVKRMSRKPGCEMPPKEAKAIWEFLVYDSEVRKLGKNAASWKAHRQKLLDDFKQKYPKRYEELFASTQIEKEKPTKK